MPVICSIFEKKVGKGENADPDLGDILLGMHKGDAFILYSQNMAQYWVEGSNHCFNPLPDNKILDWSKLKQIADDILKCI